MQVGEAITQTLDDIGGSFALRRFAVLLAWRDLTSSTRLSKLGQSWLLINPALWILTIVVFFGPQLGIQEPHYALYAATGAVLYLAIQAMTVGGSQVFSAERSIILNAPVPYFVFVMKLLFKGLVQILITSSIIILVMLYEQPPVNASILLVGPALALIAVTGVGVILVLGVIGTRYVDLHLIVHATMRVVMFVTPVFWLVPAEPGFRSSVANLNPVYHLIEMVREPVMGKPVHLYHWVFVSIFAAATFSVGLALFARYRKRLALWI